MTFGFIAASAMDGDFYVLNPAGDTFVDRKTKRVVGMGSRILVTVAQVDRVKRMLDFRLCIEESDTPRPAATETPRAPRRNEKPKKTGQSRSKRPAPAAPAAPGKSAPAPSGRSAKPIVSEPVGRADARPVFKLKKHAGRPESSGSPFTPPGFSPSASGGFSRPKKAKGGKPTRAEKPGKGKHTARPKKSAKPGKPQPSKPASPAKKQRRR